MVSLIEGSEIVAPDRSLEQRRESLLKANRIRSFRKRVKGELRTYHRSLTGTLLDPEAELLTMKVFELLVAAPKVGRVKANRWLVQTRISPSKTLGGLSARQRGELAVLIGRRG